MGYQLFRLKLSVALLSLSLLSVYIYFWKLPATVANATACGACKAWPMAWPMIIPIDLKWSSGRPILGKEFVSCPEKLFNFLNPWFSDRVLIWWKVNPWLWLTKQLMKRKMTKTRQETICLVCRLKRNGDFYSVDFLNIPGISKTWRLSQILRRTFLLGCQI